MEAHALSKTFYRHWYAKAKELGAQCVTVRVCTTMNDREMLKKPCLGPEDVLSHTGKKMEGASTIGESSNDPGSNARSPSMVRTGTTSCEGGRLTRKRKFQHVDSSLQHIDYL